MSANEDAAENMGEASYTDLRQEVERLTTVCNGAMEQIGELKERIEEQDERIDELEAENKKLRAELKSQSNTRGSKKMKAKRIAANKIMASAKKNTTAGLKGGGVTATEMMDGAEALGTSFSHSTVYSAWEALAEDWDFLHVRDGDGSKHGESKRLAANADDLPQAFVDVYAES